MEILDIRDSSVKQSYGTHPYYRFYGKLPPLVVRELIKNADNPIVDIMCGSGTTLIESLFLNKNCIGIDINPLSVLVSKVKTNVLSSETLTTHFTELQELIENSSTKTQKKLERFEEKIPESEVIQRWFEPKTQLELAMIKHHIDLIHDHEIRAFFLVGFCSILRKCSLASTRVAKLFKAPSKDKQSIVPTKIFKEKVGNMIERMEDFSKTVPKSVHADVLQANSVMLPFKNNSLPFIFWHPPYYALFRYSAIYMLELDWLNTNRRQISKGEIEEGYKSGDKDKFFEYLTDLEKVLLEAHRVLDTNGKCCVVIGDSSLREEFLPVVSSFKNIARNVGFSLEKTITRKIHFAQASYHPSSKVHMRRPDDAAIILKKI